MTIDYSDASTDGSASACMSAFVSDFVSGGGSSSNSRFSSIAEKRSSSSEVDNFPFVGEAEAIRQTDDDIIIESGSDDDGNDEGEGR